jgi:hypothetical protein
VIASITLLVLSLGACSDYEINIKGGDPNDGADGDDTLPDDGDLTGDGDTSDTSTPQDEECNGVDDDGDGRVDEGYPDLDEDGIADCVDDDCDLDVAVSSEVLLQEGCDDPDIEITDPWDVAIEWQWTGLTALPGVKNSYTTPVVGVLRDTNGDGAVDTRDVPDVAFTTVSDWLVVLAGDTGALQWAVDGVDGHAGVALADVDGDGVSDLLTVDRDGHPVLFDASGVVSWTSSAVASASYPLPAVADLDGDGSPEALVDDVVLNGVTGALEAELPSSPTEPYRMATAGDLDLDGTQEILFGDTVYDASGTPLWSAHVDGPYGLWSAPIDVDGDPEGEVLVFGDGTLAVFEANGDELLRTHDSSWDRPGPPCVADFDGDGAVEIGFASYDVFSMVEMDGTVVWERTINDSSGLAGCSGYDFDADGAYEVVYADQQRLFILDGATGTVRFRQGNHASVTAFEYPVIADVDADGSAEVLFVSNYWAEGWGGLTVLGHAGSGWARSGTTWPVHDFSVSNVAADGGVPTSPLPPWQLYNVVRARPTTDGAATDLGVDITDVCLSGCDPEVSIAHVSIQVWNEGSLDAPAGLSLGLYVEGAGGPVLLDSVALPEVPGGYSLDGVVMTIPATEVSAGPLYAVVDDDGILGPGLLAECDESDNIATWSEDPCEAE